MGEYPSLTHIDVGGLISHASGDPWKLDDTLQAGEPAQIAQLAEAFSTAGGCAADTEQALVQARQRFAAS